MRWIFFFLLFLTAGIIHSQVIYTSFYTESYPTIFTNKVELITRSITFAPNSISISTEVGKGKEIEELRIQEINSINGKLVISCTTKNNRPVTISLPDEESVNFIDYYSRKPKTREEYQLRFYIQRTHHASRGY